MKTYVLTTPPKSAGIPTDAHGQPVHLFKANAENNALKAISQLSGVCAGILADGVVNPDEVTFFADWVRKFAPLAPTWPFSEILGRLDRIFADGRCDDDERDELRDVMKALCGYEDKPSASQAYASTLPVNSPLPDPIVFPERTFNVTGKFSFGTRKKVMEAISARGGIPSNSTPTESSDYLVIGVFASRDWIESSHGRKIERAIELRDSGSGIAIIPEDYWRKFIG